MAAKAEEKRLAELRKRRQYHSDQKHYKVGPKQSSRNRGRSTMKPEASQSWRCWNCGKLGHVAGDCRAPRKGGSGQGGPANFFAPRARQVQASKESPAGTTIPATMDPHQYRLPDSDEENSGVRVTEISRHCSGHHYCGCRSIQMDSCSSKVEETGFEVS